MATAALGMHIIGSRCAVNDVRNSMIRNFTYKSGDLAYKSIGLRMYHYFIPVWVVEVTLVDNGKVMTANWHYIPWRHISSNWFQ
jgi:hypothetical protein